MTGQRRQRGKSEGRNPILVQILSENSSVVFDVARRRAKTEKDTPFFACRSLNSTIIFKMPNFQADEVDRGAIDNEWDLSAQLAAAGAGDSGSSTNRPVETGIFIPYSIENREAGGVVLYVRQKNFELLIREFLGLNYQQPEGPTKRDQEILQKIDEIPSLDPFLLKQALNRPFPDIDRAYFDITEAEDSAVRDTISRKVLPIVQKALDGGGPSNAGIEKFVNAIWNPAAPEASLFVSAFGISSSQTEETFEAWRGITYYEWSYGRVIKPIGRLLSWMQSERAQPVDAQRIGAAARQQLDMMRVSVGKKLSATAKSPELFFRDYAGRHNEFVVKNDPARFREFLKTARKNYWQLGWSITALMHAIGIFSRAATRGMDGRMPADILQELYRDLDTALLKDQTKLVSDG